MGRAMALMGSGVLVFSLAGCIGEFGSSSSDSGQASTSGQTVLAGNPYREHASDNYDTLDNWMCHPQLDAHEDRCQTDLTTLSVDATGEGTVLDFEPAQDAPVDCFYVYPTASIFPAPNSTFQPGQQEIQTTQMQAARYGEVCDVFAPVYRQRTVGMLVLSGQLRGLASQGQELESLLSPLTDGMSELLPGALDALLNPATKVDEQIAELDAAANALAYEDVVDAFRSYIRDADEERGFILLGHSQGASVLARLLAEDIENDPVLSSRMVSAHLIGSNIAVPKGADVGADFQSTPVCRHSDETGCVIGFSSYRKDDPELADPRFGVTADEQTEAICVNPASLAGGPGDLHAHIPFTLPPFFELVVLPRGKGGPYDSVSQNLLARSEAPFFAVPGQLSGQCQRTQDGVHYLEVTIRSGENDARADDYAAEFLTGDDWGLHLADVNLAQRNLVELAQRQTQAWLRQ